MAAYRLTPKQEKFCNVYLETGNASEAYRQAYDCENMSPAAINVAASRLLDHANISLRLKASTDRAAELAEYSKAQAIEDARQDRLLARELGQVGAAVSAGKLASDLSGFIVDRKDVTVRSIRDMTMEELEAESAALRAELEQEPAGATRH